MCIIVAKNKGIKMPSLETLKNCWNGNSDGAGMSWVENNIVKTKKGFMTWKHFTKHLKQLEKRVNLDETDVIMHFRITSIGETMAKMTHPFRVDAHDDKSRTLLNMDGKMFVFHNGTMSGIRAIEKKYSDTFAFTKSIAYPMYRIDKAFHTKPNFIEVMETVINGDKLAFITPKGIKLIGDFNECEGISYSNYGYEDWGKYFTPRRYIYLNDSPTTTEYLTSVSYVRPELQAIYIDYTIENVEAFKEAFSYEIETIGEWEMAFPDHKDNQMLIYELEQMGVL